MCKLGSGLRGLLNPHNMEVNITIIIIVAILVILLLIFIIRKNFQDQKDLEEKIKKTELGTDQHKEDRI